MKVVSTINEVRDIISQWKKEGLSVGLVPTMGYLHEGHGSLIEAAHKNNAKVVVSVFVNPIQFGPTEDLDKYPRDLERDSKIVEDFGGDLIFTPTPSEMYLEDFASFVEVSNLTEGLCGAKRPGHFRGVCTVVTKLFNILTPDKAYFGEKDAQQLAVIRKMVSDLNVPIEIVGCPIVRESDGLAKSSRNVYLNTEERAAALILSKSLTKAREVLNKGERSSENLRQLIIDILASEPLTKVDYVEIVDSLSLKPVENIEKDILIALAVYIGKTRLIDNFTYRLC